MMNPFFLAALIYSIDNYDNENITPGTSVEDVFLDNEGVDDEVVPNVTKYDDND